MLGLRHYQKRKRPPSDKFPDKRFVLKSALDLLIYPAAIASPLALLPQMLTLYRTHDASSFVLTSWVILCFLNLLWVVYGRVHREMPIVLTNAALMVVNLLIVIGILLYR